MASPIPLLLMADFGADPLWCRTADGKGSTMVPLDQLALTDSLKDQLRAWAVRHDQLNAPPFSYGNQAELDDWVAQGRDLLGPLSEELGPRYDVQYIGDRRVR